MHGPPAGLTRDEATNDASGECSQPKRPSAQRSCSKPPILPPFRAFAAGSGTPIHSCIPPSPAPATFVPSPSLHECSTCTLLSLVDFLHSLTRCLRVAYHKTLAWWLRSEGLFRLVDVPVEAGLSAAPPLHGNRATNLVWTNSSRSLHILSINGLAAAFTLIPIFTLYSPGASFFVQA